MAKRTYEPATIYDARIFNMRNLWEPSYEFMGKRQEKPNYFASVIIKKTRANWHEEPSLANFTQACSSLYSKELSHIPFPQIDWPLKDGDIPDPVRGQADWRIGHWLLTISSNSAIDVSKVVNGIPVPMLIREGVKNGDYVGIVISVAVKANDARGVKCYANKVMFMRPGEEIVVGSSVSNADMMADAKRQGMNVTGFGAPMSIGFGGNGGPQQGFQQGFAPTPAQPAAPAATGQFGNSAPQGGSAFPSSGLAPSPIAPPAGQGFAPPAGFNAPSGFPPRQ